MKLIFPKFEENRRCGTSKKNPGQNTATLSTMSNNQILQPQNLFFSSVIAFLTIADTKVIL